MPPSHAPPPPRHRADPGSAAKHHPRQSAAALETSLMDDLFSPLSYSLSVRTSDIRPPATSAFTPAPPGTTKSMQDFLDYIDHVNVETSPTSVVPPNLGARSSKPRLAGLLSSISGRSNAHEARPGALYRKDTAYERRRDPTPAENHRTATMFDYEDNKAHLNMSAATDDADESERVLRADNQDSSRDHVNDSRIMRILDQSRRQQLQEEATAPLASPYREGLAASKPSEVRAVPKDPEARAGFTSIRTRFNAQQLPTPVAGRAEKPAMVEIPEETQEETASRRRKEGGVSETNPQTPLEARQLLRTAAEALKNARDERESACEWAKATKEAGEKWVEEQRKLIELERQQLASNSSSDVKFLEAQKDAIQEQSRLILSLEKTIVELQDDLRKANSARENTEICLQQMLTEQRDKIDDLASQMSSMEQTISQTATIKSPGGAHADGGNDPYRLPSPQTDGPAPPQLVDKTPAVHQRQQKSQKNSTASSSSSSRIRKRTKSGTYVTMYANGVEKEKMADGTVVVRFPNGDTETTFPNSAVAYSYARSKVIQVSLPDGSTIYEYSETGQMERHFPSGERCVVYPNGTKEIFSADGTVLERRRAP